MESFDVFVMMVGLAVVAVIALAIYGVTSMSGKSGLVWLAALPLMCSTYLMTRGYFTRLEDERTRPPLMPRRTSAPPGAE